MLGDWPAGNVGTTGQTLHSQLHLKLELDFKMVILNDYNKIVMLRDYNKLVMFSDYKYHIFS